MAGFGRPLLKKFPSFTPEAARRKVNRMYISITLSLLTKVLGPLPMKKIK